MEYFFALLGQSYYFWHSLSSFRNILNAMYTFWYFLMMLLSFQLFFVNSFNSKHLFWKWWFSVFLSTPLFFSLVYCMFWKTKTIWGHYEWKMNIRFTTFSFQYLEFSKFTLILQRRPHERRNAPNDRYTCKHKTKRANFENYKHWIAESQKPKVKNHQEVFKYTLQCLL